MKKLLLFFIFAYTITAVTAQIDCNLNYYVSSGTTTIYSYNPATNTSTNTGIPLPTGASGLAISNNLNGGSPSPTFYTVVSGIYYYWNGTSWTNTGHSSGGTASVNPGGSGPYIYSLIGSSGQVWQYSGTGNSVLVTTLSGFGGPYDLIGDSQGNFYVLYAVSGNQHLAVYSPQGVQICNYTISGLPSSTAGGGYSVVNGVLYANINSGTYMGTFNGTSITFTSTTHYLASDYASCAFPPFNTTISASNSTINLCTSQTSTLTASTNISNPVYTWTGPGIVSGQGTSSIVVNQAGTYSLTVTSTSGSCSSTTTTTYSITSTSSAPAITVQGPYCADHAAIQMTASVSPGNWSASCGSCITSSGSFSPITAGTGTHTVYFTASSGCTTPVSTSIIINSLPIVNAGIDQSICIGSTVTLSGSGAASYTWNNSVTNGTAFTPVIGSTTYTVIGTDANGCTNTDQVVVNVNALPTINAGTDQTVCSGTPVTLSGSGASTYSWNNSIINGAAFTPATGPTTYTVTGTDANGCTNTDQVIVNVNALPAVNAGADQTVCSGTSVILSGSGALIYTWNNGTTNGAALTPAPGSTTYTVTGTDANGCTNTDQVVVNVNTLPTVNAGADQTVCTGTSVTLSGSGASTYTWSNGITNGAAFTPTLGVTTYTVTGTDANGCTNTDQVVVTSTTAPTINAGTDQTVCAGTSVTLIASGATTYSWNNGITNGVAFTPGTGTVIYTVTGTNPGGCSNTDQVTVTVNALPIVNAGIDQSACSGTNVTLTGSGATTYSWDNGVINGTTFAPTVGLTTYTVTGTDANGCTNTDQVVININTLPTVSAGTDQNICEGTPVTLSGSGASTYSWDNSVTNGTAFTPTVGSTTYTVTGTDANSCINTDQVVVTVNALPAVNAGTDQTICSGISVTLSGSGASTYTWDNSITNGITFMPAVGSITYTVTGTGANGCSNSDQIIVNVNALPTVNAGTDQTVCAGASVTLSGSGASTYSWDNNITNGTTFTPAVGSTTYTVLGTDVNGCTNTDQVNINVNALPNVNAGNDQIICEGTSVTLSGSGASTYTWDNSVTNGTAFTPAVGTLTYTVIGTDANNCSNTDQVIINVNTLPTVSAGTDQTICEGTAITLSGSGALTYTWDNGVSNGIAFTPAVGSITYTVIGTDANGCTSTDQVDINTNALPAVNAGTDQSLCSGASVTLSGSGATTYSWDNGITNGISFTPVTGTLTYTLTGTNVNGCQNTDQVIVAVHTLPIINAGADQTGCETNYFALSGSGAGTNGTYTWTGGITNGAIFQSPAGSTTYTVTGTDMYGCTGSDQIVITTDKMPDLQISWTQDQICSPSEVLFFNNTTDNVINCTWQTGDGASIQSCDQQLSYTYTTPGWFDINFHAETALGCQATVSFESVIHVGEQPIASFEFIKPTLTLSDTKVQVSNESVGANSYGWTAPGISYSTQTAPEFEFPPSAGTYTVLLIATNSDGCTDTAVRSIQLLDELIYYVPNAFTPDGDEHNQSFKPVFTSGFDPFDFTLKIYNRWGEVLFESHDASIGWDGTYNETICQNGVYIWTIEFKTSTSDKRERISGHLNLLR